MQKTTYLRRRVIETLQIEDLNGFVKDLSLNELLVAFGQRISADNQENILPVGELAQNYADQLLNDQLVIVRDPDDNRTYYLKAHDEHLIAVFYPVGPGYEIYAAICSAPGVLVTLGIASPTFKDSALIDAIFGFQPDVQEVVMTDKQDGNSVVPERHHYTRIWHTPALPVKASDESSPAEQRAVAAVVMRGVDDKVEVRGPIVMKEPIAVTAEAAASSGAPVVQQEPLVEISLPAGAMDGPMAHAFERAQGRQESQQNRQHQQSGGNHTPRTQVGNRQGNNDRQGKGQKQPHA